MENQYETIRLEVRDYISPECVCKVEDMVNSIEHVTDSTFDPVNNLLTVKAHRGMVKSMDIIDKLRKCRVLCEERNVVAIPVAAGILVPYGIVLRPEFAAITMSASSVSVVINALLMKRAKI